MYVSRQPGSRHVALDLLTLQRFLLEQGFSSERLAPLAIVFLTRNSAYMQERLLQQLPGKQAIFLPIGDHSPEEIQEQLLRAIFSFLSAGEQGEMNTEEHQLATCSSWYAPCSCFISLSTIVQPLEEGDPAFSLVKQGTSPRKRFKKGGT